ncbi:MAG: hypothetical protein HOV87_09460 [Catenulispora sp.]|nr:hypothetical protein [Catenulispora sp.]
MTKFADHMFEELMEQHGTALAATPDLGPARRRLSRPVWASAGTVAAAATAAVGFTVFSGTASAYAVTANHDGTVTVKVTKPSGIAGANAALHKMGSKVAVVQATPGCPSIETFAAPDHGGDSQLTVGLGPGSDPSSITVSATGLPPDETALVVYSFADGKNSLSEVPIKGQVPTCVSLPAAPPPGAVASTTGPGGNAAQPDSTGPGAGAVPAPALNQHK